MLVLSTLLAVPGTHAINFGIVMPPTAISATGDRSVFSTPIDYKNNHLVVAQVEPPDEGTPIGYLRTTVWIGSRNSVSDWRWQARTIENRTLHDPYHTQPSIAFDQDGYIHIVYNMHHAPWQYLVSRKPYDIDSLEFRGEELSKFDLDRIRLENKTNFPSAGNAAIPGNQITYPAFTKDREGKLFITYRYALHPERPWGHRDYAVGLAGYIVDKRIWCGIGGSTLDLNIKKNRVLCSASPMIFDDRYLPYIPTLEFDSSNNMHVIWTWWDKRGGLDGSNTITPSYLYIPSSGEKILSVNYDEVEKIPGWRDGVIFNTAKSIAVSAAGDVLVVLEQKNRNRQLVRRFRDSGKWSAPTEMPNSASKIRVSNDGSEWAFASGLNIFRRVPNGSWSSPIRIGKDLCDPWPIYIPEENSFFIRAKNCANFSESTIFELRL